MRAARTLGCPRAARGAGRRRRDAVEPGRMRSTRSAGGSKGCRWRSSWPLRGSGRSPPTSCSSASTRVSRCSPAGPRDPPARQRTMRSALDWSYELLEPAARHLLGRLSIFSGGFTTEAALAVGGEGTTIEQLAALVDASSCGARRDRYGLLDLVREYAGELPSADDEGRDLHALHFVRLAERAEPELTGAEQGALARPARGRARQPAGRARLGGRLRRPPLGLRLAAALGRFWYVRGYLERGPRPPAPGGRARRRRRSAGARPGAARPPRRIGLLRGDYPLAQELAQRALELYETAERRGRRRPLPEQPRRDPPRAEPARRGGRHAGRMHRRVRGAGRRPVDGDGAEQPRRRRAVAGRPGHGGPPVRAEPRTAPLGR